MRWIQQYTSAAYNALKTTIQTQLDIAVSGSQNYYLSFWVALLLLLLAWLLDGQSSILTLERSEFIQRNIKRIYLSLWPWIKR